ncbi:hypothetical protein An12g09570 [Aspergillus niger]|uniref:Uncharacterized protein n=2 Tax=Aspergillus niger TaxID=5061 RepID=A2R0S1_ASPNC|nr:hypothetical protein An12g09570 [Aspergillus niger]CAL00863.1 hypothetical protein An12g09570 [Aspergillus niger]
MGGPTFITRCQTRPLGSGPSSSGLHHPALVLSRRFHRLNSTNRNSFPALLASPSAPRPGITLRPRSPSGKLEYFLRTSILLPGQAWVSVYVAERHRDERDEPVANHPPAEGKSYPSRQYRRSQLA